MPGVLDDNVVILRFDNEDFEKNTEQSMKTLDRLKASFKDSSSADEFSKIGKAAQKVDLSGIADGVEKLNKRFSLMGTIGTQAINNLTNYAMNSTKRIVTAIPNQIIQGGWKRALNIEQAKFQIEGLGFVWDETSEKFKKGAKKIKDDVLYAVNGTAYGLDEAAKVASQLAASNVEAGTDMQTALRAVSGAAAMTSRSYEDMGRIFTTVAGQGRLMGDQLNQFAAAGLNVAAELGKQMGKTEGEIREMVSKGQIDFETFYKAMDKAFGAHAQKANETYTGSLSNLKAALSRIGADVEATKLENMRHIFNALTPVVDQFHTLLGGVITRINGMSTAVSNFAVKSLHSIEWSLKPFVDSIKGAKTEISFMSEIYDHAYMKLSKKQKKATDKMTATAEEAEVAWKIIRGDFSDVKKERKSQIEELGLSYKRVQRYTNALVKSGLDEETCHIKVAGAAKKASEALKEESDETKEVSKGSYMLKPFVAIVGSVHNVILSVKTAFAGVKAMAISVFKTVKTALTPIFSKAATEVFKYTNKLQEAAKKFKTFAKEVSSDKLSKNFKKLSPEMQESIKNFRSRLSDFRKNFATTVEKIAGYGDQLKAKLKSSGAIKTMTDSLKILAATLKSLALDKFAKMSPILDKWKSLFKETVSVDNLASKIENLANKFNTFITGLKTGVDPLNKFLNIVTTFEGNLSGKNLATFTSGLAQSKMKSNVFNNLKTVAENAQKVDLPGTFSRITNAFGKMTDTIVESQNKINVKDKMKGALAYIQGIDFEKWSSVGLKLSGMIGIFVGVKKLADVANATVGMLGSVSGFFKSLSGIANQVKTNIKVEMFRTIAMSVAMLAGSVAILAMIPKDRLGPATAAITGLMGIMVGIVALTNTGKFDAEKMKTLGVSFAGMGAAMLALAVSCEKIAKLSAGQLAKAGITITTFIGIFILSAHAAGEIQKSGKSFAMMAAAVDALVFAVNMLAAMKFETIAKGGTAILFLMTELALAARIAGEANASGFLSMALAVDLLVPAIVAIGMMPVAMILKGGTAIVALMYSLAGAAKIAGESKSNMMTMLSMTTMIVAAATALVALSFIDPIALGMATVALVSTITTIAMGVDIANQGKKGALAIAGVVAAMAGAIALLVKLDTTKSVLVAAGLSVLGMTLSKALLGFSAIPWGAVLSGLAKMTVAIAGITVAMALIGGLGKIGGGIVTKGIDAFGDLLEHLGAAFGKFTGGFLTGMSDAMPNAASNLTTFIKNLQPFLDICKDLKGGDLKGLNNLTKSLSTLTSIDFDALNQDGRLSKFGLDLIIIAAQFKAFTQALGDIPDDQVDKTKTISKIINTMVNVANDIPAEGGFAQKIEGTKNIAAFAFDMCDALGRTAGALSIIGAINLPENTDANMDLIARTMNSMARVAKAIPDSGGLLGAITGSTTIAEFAEQLSSMITPLGKFILAAMPLGNLAGNVVDQVDNICGIIATMVKTGSKIPPSGGLKQFVSGNTTLLEFARMLNTMVQPLWQFLQRVSQIPDDVFAATDKVPAIGTAITAMGDCAQHIPDTGGLKGAIKGNKKMGEFAEGLAALAPQLDTFFTNIKDLTVDAKVVKKTQNISTAMVAIAELSNSLDNSGGVSGWLFGDQDLSGFSESLGDLATGISDFDKNTTNVDPKTIVGRATGIQKAVDHLSAIPTVNTGSNLPKLGENARKFTTNINAAITKSLGSKTKAIGTAVTNLMKSANTAAKTSDLSSFTKAGEKAGNNFVKGLKNKKSDSYKAGEAVSKKANDGIGDGGSKWTAYRIGQDIGQGLINGLNSKKSSAWSAGYALGKASVDGQKAGADTGSPSKIAIQTGKYIGEGLVIGMASYERKAYKKGVTLGNKAVEGQMEALNLAIDDISSPVITPVLDTSGIQYGMDNLNSKYSVNRAMTINPTTNSDYNKMASALDKMLKSQAARPNVNNINVTVEGSENPEAFANRFVKQLQMEMRTG